uniref:Flagellar protein FlgJ N-terminal domain-containing protein n=1 Tax=Desulfobacca acetoxidans TaxID=60893 RepID=A0A7V4LCH3_9BACT
MVAPLTQARSLLPSGPLGSGGLSPLVNSLADPRARGSGDTLPKAATEVEAVFLGRLLEQLRQTLVQPVSRQSRELKGYLSLADQELARALAANGGIGLAQKIMHHLSRGQPVPSQENRNAQQAPIPGESPRPSGAPPLSPAPPLPGRGMAGPEGLPGG